MERYRCTNIGNGCAKADGMEIINMSINLPRCPECDSPLDLIFNNSFLVEYKKYIIILIVIFIVGISIYTATAANDYKLTLIPSEDGSIESKKLGLNCKLDCSKVYLKGNKVTLIPKANEGFKFKEWRGDCVGNNECNIVMDSNKEIRAVFSRLSKLVTVEKIDDNVSIGSLKKNTKIEIDILINDGALSFDNAVINNGLKQEELYAKAERKFKKAKELGECKNFPEISSAYDNLGRLYIEKKEYNLALEEYKSGKSCNKDDASFQYGFTLYHLQMGENSLALEKLDKALGLELKKNLTSKGLSLCKTLRKDFKRFKNTSLDEKLGLKLEKHDISCCRGLFKC